MIRKNHVTISFIWKQGTYQWVRIWRALFSCYHRYEICPFALLPTILHIHLHEIFLVRRRCHVEWLQLHSIARMSLYEAHRFIIPWKQRDKLLKVQLCKSTDSNCKSNWKNTDKWSLTYFKSILTFYNYL